MSASIVSEKHISGMIQAATMSNRISYYFDGELHSMQGKRQELGQKLLDENYRSYNYRYSESNKPHRFAMQQVDRLRPVEIIKMCNCYNYQACETSDWKETEACAIVAAIKERTIKQLPGYDDAPWELV